MKFVILQANVPDENGHIYTHEILEQLADKINNDVVLGHLERVEERFLPLNGCSHHVKNAEITHNKLCVEIEPLDTPEGKILKENILENLNKYNELVNFKCNALGVVDENDVVDKYEIISIDLVAINPVKPKQ